MFQHARTKLKTNPVSTRQVILDKNKMQTRIRIAYIVKVRFLNHTSSTKMQSLFVAKHTPPQLHCKPKKKLLFRDKKWDIDEGDGEVRLIRVISEMMTRHHRHVRIHCLPYWTTLLFFPLLRNLVFFSKV